MQYHWGTPRSHQLLVSLLVVGICAAISLAGLVGLTRLVTQRQADLRGRVVGTVSDAMPLKPTPSPACVNLRLHEESDPTVVAASIRIAAEHAAWVRQSFPWGMIEPAPGRYEWAVWDEIVARLSQQGLKIIAVVDTSPAWARRSPMVTAPPNDPSVFGEFLGVLASRYRGRIAAYQVWDEPNIYPHWGDRFAAPDEYVALLRAAYPRLKAADPDALVLAGGLAPTTEESEWNQNDVTYLRVMYRQGAKGLFDALAAKPYGFWTGPEDRLADPQVLNFSRLLLLREVMMQYGDERRPIWAVEMGWNALPPTWQGRASPWGSDEEDRQAGRLQEAFIRIASEWPWVGVTCLPALRYPLAAIDDPVHGFALVRLNLSPGPFLSILQDSARVAGLGRYTGDSDTFVRSGPWLQSGRAVSTDAEGASIVIPFWGTRVIALIGEGPQAGRVYLWLDGEPAPGRPRDAQGRSYLELSRDAPWHRSLVTLVALPPGMGGWHTLRIEVGRGLGGSRLEIGEIRVMYDESSWPFLASATLGLAVILAGILGAWRAAHTLPWAEAEAWFTEQPTARQVGSWVIVVFLWLVVPLPLALLMLPILVVLGAWRLDILVMLAIASAPFFRYLRPVGGQGVALAEVLILVGMASLVVRGLTWGGHSLLGDMRAILARSRTHAVIFFVIVAILSLSASEDLHLSLRELRLVVVEPALLFLLAMMVCQRDDRGREKIVWALVGSGALAAGQSLVQWLITDEVVATEGVRRALGPYGSPNNLGLLLERLLPVALSAVLLPWRGRREIAMIAVVVMGLALALTFSVGAWGGALVGVVAWGVQQGWIRTLRRRPSLFLGLVMAIVVGGGVLLSVERISSHLAITGDTTAGRRVSLWQSSLAMLRDHAIRGVGLDGFLDLYRTQYIRPEAWREPDLSHPHNLVLEWWLFLGLPGLAALGWFLVFFMMQVRHPHDSIAYGVIASLAAATAHGLVDRFYFGAPDLAIIFMCLLVLVAPPDRA